MIKRTVSDYVMRMSKAFPVVSVVGPRQSGKTTLVKGLFPKYEYLNLEDPETRNEALADGTAFFKNHPAPLVIDEIQKVPELLSRIQVAVDSEPAKKGQFILTGSQQPSLKEGLSQSLAGRVALTTLLPFSIEEINKAKISMTREEYIFKGFMPRLYQEKIAPYDLYENYLGTYVERDVNLLINLRNHRSFGLFLKLLAGRTGQILNCQSLSDDLGVSANTVKSWISILEACFIITILPCYYRNFGKRFVKSPKVYFTDVGLASHILGIRNEEQLSRDPLFGQLFENMVVMEAFKARLNKGLPPDLYFIRDKNGTEIDLVLEETRKLHLFEIKSSMSYSGDFAKNLRKYLSDLPEAVSGDVVYSGKDLSDVSGVDYCNFTKLSRRFNQIIEGEK